MIDSNLPISKIAVSNKGAVDIFYKYGLDFCCQGFETLNDLCEKKNLSKDQIIAEIEAMESNQNDSEFLDSYWNQLGVDSKIALVNHIEENYHSKLKESVPLIISLAEKVENVHQGNPSVPVGLSNDLKLFWTKLLDHIQREEEVIFQLIKNGLAEQARMPVNVRMMEHESYRNSIQNLKNYFIKYPLPQDACNSWRTLFMKLEEFIKEVQIQIHLENNILFPKILAKHSCCGMCS